jgi:hypothetical protein
MMMTGGSETTQKKMMRFMKRFSMISAVVVAGARWSVVHMNRKSLLQLGHLIM